MAHEAHRVGRRGTIVIPARLRRRYGLEEGTFYVAESLETGILIRPAVALPVEIYGPERKAELLLENAVDEEDDRRAREEVVKLGLDPDAIPHQRPGA
jgi:AbrB family looped-hinge helix DNA binding protein